MEISFTKKKEGGHIISCKRKDGTVTWMHSGSFFVLHDICHYAVETKLGFKNAFYGMLDSGVSITDFELPKDQRPFELTEEAIFTEHVVNLLGIEYNQGRFNDFRVTLSASYKVDNALPEELTDELLKDIREEIGVLMNKWGSLTEEETLTLEFEK